MAISGGPLQIPSLMFDSLSLAKRDEMMTSSSSGPIHLTHRFSVLKESLTKGKETVLTSSWNRLLHELSREIDLVSALGTLAIPIINFADIENPQYSEQFLGQLRLRGVGVIRGVIPQRTASTWWQETQEYIGQSRHPKPQDVYWSPAQVKARACPNILAAQRFVMSIWKSRDPTARVTTSFPITYADRMSVRRPNHDQAHIGAHVDGGSVERWEPDGYGRAGTYNEIFQGRWEQYDPWESSTRLGVTSDLYHRTGACSIFRMFQGWLALKPIPSGRGSVHVCPLPRHATAYFLLRPFFSPRDGTSNNPNTEWSITSPQNSILHGALPSYAQEIHPSLHPHLQLDRSLVPVPALEPGDYLIWHPDLIHAISSPPTSSSSSEQLYPMYMYLPACPLTQTNALYLARQRKAFLRGHPGPDFFEAGAGLSSFGGRREPGGEADHAGHPGVRDVNDAGGDDGLRAMGLLPWDEEEALTDHEREVLAMANGILFPDLYDMI